MEFKILYNSDGEIRQLRHKTFVLEKNVPEELEFDGKDDEYMHFCLYDRDILVACARIDVQGDILHAGRVAVQTKLRGNGVGTLLFEHIENFARNNGLKQLKLGAIETAVGFYKKVGFITVGDYYDEAGWPHINMIKDLT